jgi:hypothetical protein
MEAHMRLAEFIANLLDNQFGVGSVKVGIDPLLDLIPGVGNIIAVSFSFYLVWIGLKLKIPRDKIAEMIGNIFLDFLIGAVPVLGTIGDVFYKSNLKNLKILKQYYKSSPKEGTIL